MFTLKTLSKDNKDVDGKLINPNNYAINHIFVVI